VINLLHFALLGLGLGAIYALPAQGIVLVYRSSGVINFAQGAIGVAAAYVEWELQFRHGQSYVTSVVVAVAFAAAIGLFMQTVMMQRLRFATPTIKMASTLGVLLILEAIATLLYGADQYVIPSELPSSIWDLGDGISVTSDRIYLFLLAIAVTVALWLCYRYSKFGRNTNAVAENPRAASSVGLSPNTTAAWNWAIGSGLAAIAAILLVPIQTLTVGNMDALLLPTLAAALVGGFQSFPLTLVGAIIVGVLQSELTYYTAVQGVSESAPFVVIVIMLVARGRSLPLRDYFLQRLPLVGTGRIAPIPTGVALIAVSLLMISASDIWAGALTQSITGAIILLSVVVVTGYAGQISLAQAAIGGFSAWIAASLSAHAGLSFLLSLIVGVAASVPVALIFGFTAMRTRGLNLAIATLGLGAAIEYIILDNQTLTGGVFGLSVQVPTLFGYSLDPLIYPQRYGLLCFAFLVVAAVAVANVRRGSTGRRLLAVRANERAAAALGINVPETKLYAFALSSAIAGLGGVLMAFQNTIVSVSSFTTEFSVILICYAVICSVGFIGAAFVGSLLIAGGIGTQAMNYLFAANSSSGNVGNYLSLVGGAVLVLYVLQDPDGLTAMNLKFARSHLRKLGRRAPRPLATNESNVSQSAVSSFRPCTLEVEGLTVQYGGIRAVNDVTLRVTPGRVVGLIGPNGAGKTSFIDAVTGFVDSAVGKVTLDSAAISGLAAHRRARAGLVRSFQSLELFDDLTVLENLRSAADGRERRTYLTELVKPRRLDVPGDLSAVLRKLNLSASLDRVAGELSHGERRLLAIARAIALRPRVLLLDEPAAGLTSVETKELGELIRWLARDCNLGVLLVEHDVELVLSLCDEVVVLNFGEVIARGNPDKIRNDPIVIEAYIGGPASEPESGDGVGVAVANREDEELGQG
jgi:ABC-type branched-subunit amino acid transport system ATPase component/branched-subunit amino acid ABC-type transport system permease component